MSTATKLDTITETALIYCRVSSKKQTTEGSGLQSQEHRCMAHALQRRYDVEKTFLESVSGGLDIMDRPAMRDLLRYLDTQQKSGKRYVVVFDDHKRFARDTEIHLRLRREMDKRGARVEYLNFAIENTPEGTFIDTMLAAQSQLEREQIGKQTKQKTLARLERGLWTFRAPYGYKYVPSKTGGKELVLDEPMASEIREAMEGFASGRFATQAEVKRFLESQPHFPKCLPNGEIRTEKIRSMFSKVLYAGYLEAPSYNVSRRKAQHEGLITLETWERIQQRRSTNGYLPTRKDINKDFVLRGAVCCSECDHPYTSGWSKSSTGKKYAYYFCQQKKCDMYGKTIPRDKLEGEFAELLKTVQPSKGLFNVMQAMFKKAWGIQQDKADAHAKTYEKELAEAEKEINTLLDRIMDASSPRVVQAYEKRIDELEDKKLILAEKAATKAASRYSFEEMFELSMTFLSNPQKLWHSKRFAVQRMVLKLVFCGKLHHHRNEGYRTPQTTSIYAGLKGFLDEKVKMVPPARLELARPKSTDFKSAASTIPPRGQQTGIIRISGCLTSIFIYHPYKGMAWIQIVIAMIFVTMEPMPQMTQQILTLWPRRVLFSLQFRLFHAYGRKHTRNSILYKHKGMAVKIATTIIALGCLAATAANAAYEGNQYKQNRWPHWYIGVQGSIPFVEETDVNVNSSNAGDLDFDSGYGVGVSLGYTPRTQNAILNNSRFELEYYYRQNELDEFNAGGASTQISDDIASQTYMINYYYDFKTDSRMTPYVGAGIGVAEVDLTIPSLAVDDEDSVMAYQLMAGLGWQPEALLNTVLQVGYRFVDTTDNPEFSAINGQRLDHEYMVHSIEAGARFRF